MTTTKTCGGCAWYRMESRAPGAGQCIYPLPMLADDSDDETYTEAHCDATNCKAFRSHADAALIAECHRLRSLGAAIPWSDVDRLVEIAAGKPLERKKRCDDCHATGKRYKALPDGPVVVTDCDACHGTGYQGGDT